MSSEGIPFQQNEEAPAEERGEDTQHTSGHEELEQMFDESPREKTVSLIVDAAGLELPEEVTAEQVLKKAGLTEEDVDFLTAHAHLFTLEGAVQLLELPDADQTTLSHLQERIETAAREIAEISLPA